MNIVFNKIIMETSIFIAKVIAIAYLSFGIGLLLNKNYYKKIFKDMFENQIFMMLGGMMALILGTLIINIHNNWVGNWTVIITIIGWIALVKGVVMLALPRAILIFEPMFKCEKIVKYLAPFVIIIGLIFGYLGFM